MPKRPRPRRRRRGTILILPLLAVLAALFVWRENTALQVESFSPVFRDLPQGFDGCRAVVLGDLHSASFGEGNERLLEAVEDQEPEYIFLVGDLLDSLRDVPEGYAEETAVALAAIAPTYYVTGNHEWAVGHVPELKKALEAQGVTVLSNRSVTLERGGDTVVLAGIDDPNGYADQKSPEAVAAEVRAVYGDPFWILLAHRNNYFPGHYSRLGADLVVSGHGHGGLIRLPFTDGLLSTDRTFFPSYTAGLYEEDGSTLFVTRGLGNSGRTFRLFDRPEVAVVTLRRG
ncbi:metallophosphoesterase [uncultured Oscillibacter sp.]|uniref:metallophosphoesterase n=1 Tax=uncultured Oscillibacter sp. TaxID=876091 RepID=UPI0025E6E80E|nr:metallophosphoesterase [uncultured Oscillibacter sp.]